MAEFDTTNNQTYQEFRAALEKQLNEHRKKNLVHFDVGNNYTICTRRTLGVAVTKNKEEVTCTPCLRRLKMKEEPPTALTIVAQDDPAIDVRDPPPIHILKTFDSTWCGKAEKGDPAVHHSYRDAATCEECMKCEKEINGREKRIPTKEKFAALIKELLLDDLDYLSLLERYQIIRVLRDTHQIANNRRKQKPEGAKVHFINEGAYASLCGVVVENRCMYRTLNEDKVTCGKCLRILRLNLDKEELNESKGPG